MTWPAGATTTTTTTWLLRPLDPQPRPDRREGRGVIKAPAHVGLRAAAAEVLTHTAHAARAQPQEAEEGCLYRERMRREAGRARRLTGVLRGVVWRQQDLPVVAVPCIADAGEFFPACPSGRLRKGSVCVGQSQWGLYKS